MANNSASYNINMRFTADTGQAKQQLTGLQNSLNQLMNEVATKNVKFFDATATKKQIEEASDAVRELKIALDEATNVNTGRLDLSKFSKSISQSGYTLEDFATHLENLGPTGDKAFVQLAQSVINAEVPLKRTNALLDNFKKTLANTVKWQISSNMMHGVEGALKRAYSYAEDLNESLTDIRIVTGQNTQQMAQFAEKANKAAQALSTTTTNYTNASLIYYQQGLNDNEVQKRTDVTIKMANAARESASTVSDQLTAVWNNFYDGSKSLEYYADVMVKLGAYTASSTDEISAGVQKFASVANTIGLSYEYATSALATLTAKTRESAETVGNSLKTLFARIQGLSLGETLDDGTDLNKYSKALAVVGINIKDQNDELKDMNTILDEMMNKWDNLSRAQQVALAQTVGGVRQYTQLVNLMENKDYFKELVGVAKNSKGTLQEQADIYAEGWEAARKRVQAALEELYSNLIDDKFFIKLTDGLTDVINLVDNLVDRLGGMPGLLTGISSILLKTYDKDLINNLQRIGSNLFIESGAATNQATIIKQQMLKTLKNFNYEGDPESLNATEFQTRALVDATEQSYNLQMASDKLNESEKTRLTTLKQMSDAYADIALKAKQAAEAASANTLQAEQEGFDRIFRLSQRRGGGVAGMRKADMYYQSFKQLSDSTDSFMAADAKGLNTKDLAEQVLDLQLVGAQYDDLKAKANDYILVVDNSTVSIKEQTVAEQAFREEFAKMQVQYQKNGQALQTLNAKTNEYINNLVQKGDRGENGGITRDVANELRAMIGVYNTQVVAVREAKGATEQYSATIKEFTATLERSQGALQSFSQGLVNTAQGISQILFSINSISSAIKAFNNDDLSFWEKFSSIITSLSFGIPSLINGFNSLTNGLSNIKSNWSGLGLNILQLTTGLSNLTTENLSAKLAEVGTTAANSSIRFKVLTGMVEGYEGAAAGANASSAAMVGGFKALIGAIGPYAIAVGLAVAAIAALVAYQKNVETFSVEAQLKRAESAAADLEEQLGEVQSKAEEVVDAFESYDKVKQSLDNCTAGTKEWRDTLSQANEEALNILKTYPEISKIEGAWGKNNNGEIWVDTSYLDQVKSIYDQQANTLQYSLANTEANIGQLKIQQATEGLTKEVGGINGSNALTGTFGSEKLFRDDGTGFEVQWRDLVPLIAKDINSFSSDLPREILEQNISDLFTSQGWFAGGKNQTNFDSIVSNVADNLIENGTSLDNLSTTIQENTNAVVQATKEATIQQALGLDTMSAEESKTTSALVDARVEELKDLYYNTDGTLRYKADDGTFVDIGTHNANYGGTGLKDQAIKNLWDKYLEAIGQTGNDEYKLDTKNSVKGTGADRYFNFADSNHEKLYLTEVLEVVATADAMAENLNSTYQTALDLLSALRTGEYGSGENRTQTSAGKEVGQGIAEFVGNGDLGNLNDDEIDKYISGLKELGEEGFQNTFAQGLFGKDFNLLTEKEQVKLKEQMSALGIDSYDAYVVAQEQEANRLSNAVSEIYGDKFFKYILSKNENSTIDSVLTYFAGYSDNLKFEITSMLKDAFSSAGFEGVQALTQAINEAGKDLTLEQLDQIQDAFKKSTSVDDFIQQLKKLGITTDDGVEAWINYYNIMTKVGNNLPISQFEDFRQVLSDIINLMNGEVGSVIDQEKIDELEKLGLNWEKYYVQTGPDEYTQTQEYTTEDKNRILGSTIDQMEENGQYAEQNEDRILNKTTIDGKTLDEWVSALTAEGAEQASGDVISRIAMAFDGIENLAKFTGISADQFDSKVFEQMDATSQGSLIQSIIDAFASNKEYVNNIQSARQEAYSSADSVKEISQMDGFNIADKTSQQGLVAWAAKNQDIEGNTEALNQYNYEMEQAGDNADAAQKAVNNLYNALRDNEIKEATKEISKLKTEYKELREEGEDTAEVEADLKQKVKDLFNFSESDYQMNQPLIEKFLWGSDDEAALAGQVLDMFSQIDTDLVEKINESAGNLDFSTLYTEAQSKLTEITNLLAQNDGFVVNGKITADGSQALAAIAPISGSLEEMCGWINAMGQVGIHFTTDQLQQLLECFAQMADIMGGKDISELTSDDAAKLRDLKSQIGDIVSVASENSTVTQGDGGKYLTTENGNKGGGGGGSSSTKSAADIGKEIQDKQIEVKEKKRERLEAMRDGASPEDAQKYIQEEIDLLEEEKDILEDQIKSWKKLLKLKVQEFNQKHPEFEIKLTDDGEIANASELWGKVWAEYEKNMENGMSEEELSEWFQQISDDINGPMGIQQNIDENVALIAQKEKEAAELELESITKAIDWKIKQIDYQIKRLNYYQEKLLKQAHGNKQTIEAMLEGFAYQEQEMLQLFDKGATLRDGIDQLNAAKAKYPNQAQMFDEQILEYQSDLIDVNEAILDLRNDIEDLVQNVMDLALDEIDKQIERLDTYTSMLDHLNNIIDLSGRSMLDMGLKTQIGATKVETMLGKMKALKAQMDGLTKAQKEAEAALADRRADNDESSVKFWENQVEVIKQEVEKASEEFLASWEETLEAAQELFEMRVELAVNTLANALSPFETLEQFQDNYEKAKTINEEYLDDAERLYELNKLNRQLNQQLNDSSDLLARQKLKELQQEINDLQADGVQMSQYDLEYLQKKYDLQLAEIALMEQQNSKTSMRLVRDAAGNWTYAYDADEEKIEDATQKYEDAVYELGKLSKDYINDVSEQLIQNQIDFKEALQDLDKNSADYSNQLLALQEYYVERQRYLLDELNKGVENSGQTFHDTLYGQMTDLYDYNDAYMLFVNNSNTTISELQTNYKDWQKVVETAMNVAGTSWDSFGTDMGGTLDSLEEHIQKLCDEIEELVDVLMGYISQSIGMVLDWEQKYSKRTDEELAKNEQYIDGNFTSSGGGGSLSNVDMQTDFTALLQRWDAGERNLSNYNGSKIYNSIEEIKADLNAKLDAFAAGEDILYQGSGESFNDKDNQDVIDKYWTNGLQRNGGNYTTYNTSNAKSSITSNAYKYMGVPYVWGGTSSTGLDCSGLVYKALTDSGVDVPRTTAQGYKDMATAISANNLKSGDLVFFGANGLVDHVGIYTGNGQMINATGARVQMTDIATKKAGLIGYGRIGNNLPSAESVIDKYGLRRNSGAASGAYTGDWGPGEGIGIDNGKIIKVHPKELILNKKDTSNILKAVDLVRNMNGWIDKQVQSIVSSGSAKLDSMIGSAVPPIYETQPIKQEVSIDATFPGVTDHYEVEEALSNLVNNAAQYISTKKTV